MAQKVGHNCRVKINGTVLRADSFEFAHTCDTHDVTCAREAGDVNANFRKLLTSNHAAEVRIHAHWNDEDNPFSSAGDLKIYPRSLVDFQIYLDSAVPALLFDCDAAYVTSCTTRTNVRGVVEYDFVVMNDGNFSIPQNSILS